LPSRSYRISNTTTAVHSLHVIAYNDGSYINSFLNSVYFLREVNRALQEPCSAPVSMTDRHVFTLTSSVD
jgi:hypothetical protein